MWLHLLLPFAFSTIFILRFTENPLQFVILLIGLWLGFCFIMLDRLLHALYVEPEKEFSIKLRDHWQKKDFWKVIKMIWKEAPSEQSHLISRSTIFMICFMALAVYVVTSTANNLGIGIVLGIGLHYCLDLLMYHPHHEFFSEQFLWQMKRKFNATEVKWLVGGFLLYFVMLTLITLR